MVKMSSRNQQLKSTLGAMPTVERVKETVNMPKEDTVNRQGYKAYSLDDELRLISMLNTLKLEPQFYRSENQTMRELRDLIEKIAIKDPYFVCQAIVYSRCMGEGMRSINHLAAALVAPFISGQEYAKRFYGPFDRKNQRGGCIYRPDDMSEIKDVYCALNKNVLSNSMKKGFAKVLENLDGYSLAKYKSIVVDVANLAHPNSAKSKAVVSVDGEKVKVLDAIMKGVTVTADTWEAAQSEAGQEVAKAVKDGKLSKDEAEKVLREAKNQNWNELLKDRKLGVLAALRNIRNIIEVGTDETVKLLCELLRNGELLKKGKIMPYQIDTAYEVVHSEMFGNRFSAKVISALQDGYALSLPNLKEVLPGKTCVMIDCSGSMGSRCYMANGRASIMSSASDKAGLIAATVALATGGDVVRFGSCAEFASYGVNDDVFALGKKLGKADMGGTCIGAAFELIRKYKKAYDRIILISDNECNSSYGGHWVSTSYKNYVHDVTSPYVYCIDMCAYSTVPLKNEGKVNYYYGYGYAMFDDIASKEFNPSMHIDKVRAVVI